jgi:DEAD/DEAH box helicase domain-containing protein
MRQYLVTRLDLKRQNVLVKPQELNYYTRARSEKETEILGMPLRTQEFPGFTVREAKLKVTEIVGEYEKRRTKGQDLIGVVDLELPPIIFKTVGIWLQIPERVKDAVEAAGLHFMGGIHALEHAAISLFPLYVLCDRDDIGGIATTFHEQVQGPAVFIYDGHPGGVGLSHRAYDRIADLLKDTRLLVEECPCEDGCPSCIHSPKCGSGNKPLDKAACLAVLKHLLEPEMINIDAVDEKSRVPPIFPDLEAHGKPNDTNDFSMIPEVTNRRAKVTKGRNAVPKSSDRNFGPGEEEGLVASPESSDDERQTRFAARGVSVAVFDLETQKLADEVGGWNNVAKMKLSLAVVHTEEHGFQTFTEETVQDLVNLLKRSDLVVGFNHVGFDYQVLSAYTSENLRALPNLDILAEVKNILGFRLKLQHIAEVTLGEGKTGDGLDAVKWFREGRMDLVEKYCRDDVRITRGLYLYGLEKGYLLYRRKDGIVTRIPVKWDPPACKG